jgi:hypothetical protein
MVMDCITCFVLSNSSLSEFPENSLTDFKNELPFQLESGKVRWSVSLDRIGISIDAQQTKPRFMRIRTSIIKPQVYNNTHSVDIAIITPRSDIVNEKYLFWRLENKQYYPLANTNLTTIDISVCDQDGNAINLKPGTATIVQLSFRKMSIKDRSFNMYARSEPTTEYPNNISSSFDVRLPKVFSFDKYWKVGLTIIHFKKAFLTFPAHPPLTIEVISNERKELIIIPNAKYSTESLVDKLSGELQKHNILLRRGSGGYIIFTAVEMETKINLSNPIASVLGCSNTFTLTAQKTSIRGTKKINVEYFKPAYFMIYCDIIDPIPVGNGYKQLLAVVNWAGESNNDSYYEYEIKNVLYHKLLHFYIENIHFEIRSHAGDLIAFETESDVLLHLNYNNFT